VTQGHLPFERKLEAEFQEWSLTEDGIAVIREASRRALLLVARGFRHYSIDAILHSIRFDRSIAAGPDHGFKINNDRSAHLARHLMLNDPELDGFFETRELRGR